MTILQKKRLLAVTTFAACAAIPGLAQEAPVAGATPQAGTGEDIIVLTPFEVTANSDTGYVATETLAGTRIRTNLGDVGSAITVLTKDFLSDIGATDSSTLLQYTPNAEVAGTRSTYTGLGNMQGVDETASLRSPSGAQRMRGLAAANNTRDFFATDIPWDSFNVDRVDIQRGANSMLFGLGSPAGIINATVQGADFRNAGTAEYRVASYGSQRGVLNLNQQLVDKVLAIRVAGLWDHENFSQKHAFENDERVFVAAKFDPKLFKDPGFHTSFRAKYEHGEIDANRPRIVPPNDSITPWYRPMATDQSSWTLDNGMGKTVVNNGYDANRQDTGSFVAGNGLALQTRRTLNDNPNYQPWLTAPFNQQQPIWFFNGDDGQNYRVYSGYINTGVVNPSSGTMTGRNYADQFFGLNPLSTYATNASIPLSGSGQYRNASLTDDSIFDFYNDLIDGPNKREWENWNTYNIEFSQTAFNDRVGLQLAYDHQNYKSGGEGLLGTLINGAPTITIDILKNFQDYYLLGVSGAQEQATNPNFGRPYVISTAGGTGTSYESSREYLRGSLFGELRASDFTNNEFWVKLLGKHRFNAVFSKETYSTENRAWQNLAMPQGWDAYWNNNDGSKSSLRDRPPVAAIYLGNSVAGLSSASGANIPGIQGKISYADSPIYIFNSTWNADPSVLPTAPWNVPSSLSRVFNGLPYGFGNPTQLTQASNPDNYNGWSYYSANLMRYDGGADERLLIRAQMLKKVTTSSAFSWQGYFLNEAIVPTIGWRHDKVKQKSVAAASKGNANRSTLVMSPDVYVLPGEYSPNQTYAADSKTYSGVVHLNKLLGKKDVLPLNVSLTYSKSDNFDVTDLRVDLYGNPIDNPTGSTKDYGILLSTKDGKYSLRAIKYKTEMTGATSTLSNTDSIGQVVSQGLRFRNVFLYRIGDNYEWSNAEKPQQRNTWGGTAGNPALAGGATNAADTTITYEEGLRRTDEAIRSWNEIQAWLTPKGFFQAWGFAPQAVSCLTDRSTYLANPSAYLPPDTSRVTSYNRTRPQGFAVTEDSTSEGYEFELTANPLPNWRVSFNASKSTAIRNNVGGPELTEFVNYIDGKLYNADGTQTWAGLMPQFGNTGLSINNNIWNAFRGSYMLLKLQEGAAASELRKWHFNVVTNYTFQSGFLKNVGVGGSYRWQDKVVIGYPVVPEGARYSFDLSKPYYGDPESGIDLWVSYERKLTSKINWKIQVNVRNLGEKDGLIPVTVQPDGKTWATVRVKPTEEWSLTNTFSF